MVYNVRSGRGVLHSSSSNPNARNKLQAVVTSTFTTTSNPPISIMADAATTSPAVQVKKATKPKVPAAHPPYSEMVMEAIGALKERGGSSRQAILKYLLKNYQVGDNETAVNSRLKAALKNGVKGSTFKQTKGTGASGSFRVGEKPKPVKKPAAKKPVAEKEAKPKKAKSPGKKVTTPKDVKTKKSPAVKAKSAKPKSTTPKKAAKPKAVAAKPKAAAAAKPKALKTAKPKAVAAKPKAVAKPKAAKKMTSPKKAMKPKPAAKPKTPKNPVVKKATGKKGGKA